MAEVPPIRPRQNDMRDFERSLRRVILDPAVKDIQRKIDLAGESYESIRTQIINIPNDPLLDGLSKKEARKQAATLKAYHTKKFKKTMRRFLGVRIDFLSDAAIASTMENAIIKNAELIKTIPRRYQESLIKDTIELNKEPFNKQNLRKMLSEKYRSSGYNLRRLVRDQTSKTIGALNHVRQVQVGIEKYTWSTSQDRRVRPSHRGNAGHVFSWNSPPVTGHPGEDINCRCSAVPVLPAAKPITEPPKKAMGEIHTATSQFVKSKRIGKGRRSRFWEGKDGVVREIAEPDDPLLAYNESVVNNIYRSLDVDTPETIIFNEDGYLSTAKKQIDNRVKKMKDVYQKAANDDALDGFIADLLLDNKNIDESIYNVGGKAFRQNNANSLVFDSTGNAMRTQTIDIMKDFNMFSARHRHNFRAADLARGAEELGERGLEQIRKMRLIRKESDDFQRFFPKYEGIDDGDRVEMLRRLRVRADAIEKEIVPRFRSFENTRKILENLSDDSKKLKSIIGDDEFTYLRRDALEAMEGSQLYGLDEVEVVARYAYTTSRPDWGYSVLNDGLRTTRNKSEKIVYYDRVLKNALSKMPEYKERIVRAVDLPKSVFDKMEVGKKFVDNGYASFAKGKRPIFNTKHIIDVESRTGRDVSPYSAHKGESEVLMRRGTEFKILEIKETSSGKYRIKMEETGIFADQKYNLTEREKRLIEKMERDIERNEGKYPPISDSMIEKMNDQTLNEIEFTQ